MKSHQNIFHYSMLLWTCLCIGSNGFALENTKVLPKGVRNLNIKSVDTVIDSKTDAFGSRQPLGSPMEQDLTFAQIMKDQSASESRDLRAFLLAHQLSEEQVVGSFTADLKGRMRVLAPIISYGISDSLTLALAVPYYQAKTAVSVGFRQTSTASQFVGYLADPANNQVESARMASTQFNNAVASLDTKLSKSGYRSLVDWHGSALGDITLAAKNHWRHSNVWTSALTTGLVAPTGKPDDPDILNDIGFGDGQWDLFGQFALDQKISRRAYINQYAKYTWQAPAKKSVRLVTDEENISVPKANVLFDLGDRFEGGLSLNYDSPWGLVAGVGYSFLEKAKDNYRSETNQPLSRLEANTVQRSHCGEFSLGYSTVGAYQQGKFAVPFEVRANYVRQNASVNLPVTHLALIDTNLFF